MLNDGSKTYLYNQANQLITITATGLTLRLRSGQAWSATYASTALSAGNGEGARLRQIVNGTPTTYTLDLAAPLVTALTERTGAMTKQYVYGQGDSPMAVYTGTPALSGVEGWTYLSGRDGLNSVRQETDAAGNVLTARSFDPYGVPLQGGGVCRLAIPASRPTSPGWCSCGRGTCSRGWGRSCRAICGQEINGGRSQ